MQIIIVSTSDVRIQWDRIYKAYSIVPATWEQLKGVTYHHYFLGRESAYSVGDQDLIPGSGRSPGKGNGNPLRYSCLENPMGRGPWWATVHGVSKSRTRLSDFHSHHHYQHHCFQVHVICHLSTLKVLHPKLENKRVNSLEGTLLVPGRIQFWELDQMTPGFSFPSQWLGALTACPACPTCPTCPKRGGNSFKEEPGGTGFSPPVALAGLSYSLYSPKQSERKPSPVCKYYGYKPRLCQGVSNLHRASSHTPLNKWMKWMAERISRMNVRLFLVQVIISSPKSLLQGPPRLFALSSFPTSLSSFPPRVG